MDIELARTFLAIVRGGSFAQAAEALHVTQTAVSARVRSLEEQIGGRLFVRNKAGARLTKAGDAFLRHASSLIQIWERAREDAGLPPGRDGRIDIGCELSLWHPLMIDWLALMTEEMPRIALRAEVDDAERLLERVLSGTLDLAVLYNPPQRPGLVTELLADEKLVMVTTSPDCQIVPGRYVLVDWGPAFAINHDAAFPELRSPATSISLGPLALAYILRVGGTGFFRLSAALPFLSDGRLHRVRGTPEFSHSIHAVYAVSSQGPSLADVLRMLRSVALASGRPPVASQL
jgi:LysR family transcriptional regulator, flagellar master operon regulator